MSMRKGCYNNCMGESNPDHNCAAEEFTASEADSQFTDGYFLTNNEIAPYQKVSHI